jgi:hypothetical protein
MVNVNMTASFMRDMEGVVRRQDRPVKNDDPDKLTARIFVYLQTDNEAFSYSVRSHISCFGDWMHPMGGKLVMGLVAL